LSKKIRNILESIRSSLWFWPVLITLAAAALAQAMILLDHSGWLAREPRLNRLSTALGVVWLFGAGAEGARSLLAAIAASMITIAATVFSITIVALSLAAGQMGPRLLRTFMRDRSTQISLGIFIATFAYCIIVLGVVDASGNKPFVPQVSVTVAFMLAFASLAMLIYFIHHVAKSIQAPQVIAVVGSELEEAIDHLYPGTIGADTRGPNAPEFRLPEKFADASAPVSSRASGYVLVIDGEALAELAAKTDVVLWLGRRPGDHVIAGTEIARIWPTEKCTDQLREQVREAFSFGAVRNPVQDVRFLVNQLVEIAQRALSPGINDPITAEACVDFLGVALGKLARRSAPPACRVDADGKVRVITQPDTFASILNGAFDPIRSCSRTSLQVSVRLAAVIAELAQLAGTAEQRNTLLDQVQMIRRGAGDLPEARDRDAVETQCHRAIAALSGLGHASSTDRAVARARDRGI
jgi:uncharacterized membrane protein